MNYQKRLKLYVGCMCGIVAFAAVLLPFTTKEPQPASTPLTSVQYDSGWLPGDDVEAKEPTIVTYDEEGNEHIEDYENYLIEQALIEQGYYRDDIPLSYEDQDYLQTACNEFDIEYALALGVIEQETNFQNIMGDNGNSYGYMQIYAKWHRDRMAEIGANDLTDPYDNFRVGCHLLRELYDKYENWTDALTAYNTGSGGTSKYAASVLCNMEKWQNVLDS